MADKPLGKIIIRNTSSTRNMELRRVKTAHTYVIAPLGTLGVEIHRKDPFIGINLDTGVVTIDMGEE